MSQDSQPSVQNNSMSVVESSDAEIYRHLKRLRQSFSEEDSCGDYEFDPEVERVLFVKMIVKHDLPLTMCENPYFRSWISSIIPTYEFRTISAVEEDLMSVYLEEKRKVFDEIKKSSSRVTLSIDEWKTEHQNQGYVSITCHFVDDDWVLRRRIIALRVVEYPFHGVQLSDWLKEQIEEWCIADKMFGVVVDNVSNDVDMLEGLKGWLNEKKALLHGGDMFHFRSFADIIDIIVKIGLGAMQGLIEKVRKSVLYIDSSTERSEKFELALTQCQLSQEKRVPLDVDTRWDSTYDMLSVALELRVGFKRFFELDSGYRFLPSDEEWDKGKRICECLDIFTGLSKCPSLNYYFLDIFDIRVKLGEWKSSDVAYIADMASLMSEQFEKYWEEYNMTLTVVAILDPRYKMKVVEFFHNEIDKELASTHIDKVRDFMFGLFSEYPSPSNIGDSTSSRKRCSRKGLGMYYRFMSENKELFDRKNNLEQYLEERLALESLKEDDSTFDILEWWKLNGPRFPKLAKMARDILAIPATSVASESAFTQARRVISDSNSSLKYESVEALVCLKDWLPPLKNEGVLEETQVDDSDDADTDMM